jgi:hypothetical protein
MSKTVEFRVLSVDGEQMIDNYYLPYSTANELRDLIQEAREVWSEFKVEVETDLFVQSFSHTYSEEVLMNNK